MRRLLAGAAAVLLAEAALVLAVVGLGGAPVDADRPPSGLERWLLGTALRTSVARRTKSDAEPPPPSADDLAAGAEIYAETCARCHGGTSGGASALGASFHPPAPVLREKPSVFAERELFWIIKHGVRNTGMPAWGSLLSDEDIRRVAAVVKRFSGPPASPSSRRPR